MSNEPGLDKDFPGPYLGETVLPDVSTPEGVFIIARPSITKRESTEVIIEKVKYITGAQLASGTANVALYANNVLVPGTEVSLSNGNTSDGQLFDIKLPTPLPVVGNGSEANVLIEVRTDGGSTGVCPLTCQILYGFKGPYVYRSGIGI